MNGRRLLVCSVVLNSFALVAAHGQLLHFDPIASTGQDASLILPTSANPNIDGVELAIGDEIGVFSTQGLTVGAGSWSGANIVITVRGDDAFTPEIDGVIAGDTILIRVWDQSIDEELDDVLVTYSQGNGRYATDAILELSSLEAQSILPVELASFDAVVSGNDVHLSWVTLSERDNAGFEIQQRVGDGPFLPIAFVSGEGTSSIRVSYSHDIPNLAVGLYAFRFKQVDFRNTTSFSPVVEVAIRGDTPRLLANYPNPFDENTTVSFTLPQSTHVSLRLFDVVGRLVRVLASDTMPAGTHEVELNAGDLPAGVYFQRLEAESYVETRRLQVLR